MLFRKSQTNLIWRQDKTRGVAVFSFGLLSSRPFAPIILCMIASKIHCEPGRYPRAPVGSAITMKIHIYATVNSTFSTKIKRITHSLWWATKPSLSNQVGLHGPALDEHMTLVMGVGQLPQSMRLRRRQFVFLLRTVMKVSYCSFMGTARKELKNKMGNSSFLGTAKPIFSNQVSEHGPLTST